ncbi:MAG TPA: hypothetical protein VII76_13640 [Acidimicrobiales bacterium]
MPVDFAYATSNVLDVTVLIMAVAAVVAFIGLRPGVQENSGELGADPAMEASRGSGAA